MIPIPTIIIIITTIRSIKSCYDIVIIFCIIVIVLSVILSISIHLHGLEAQAKLPSRVRPRGASPGAAVAGPGRRRGSSELLLLLLLSHY